MIRNKQWMICYISPAHTLLFGYSSSGCKLLCCGACSAFVATTTTNNVTDLSIYVHCADIAILWMCSVFSYWHASVRPLCVCVRLVGRRCVGKGTINRRCEYIEIGRIEENTRKKSENSRDDERNYKSSCSGAGPLRVCGFAGDRWDRWLGCFVSGVFFIHMRAGMTWWRSTVLCGEIDDDWKYDVWVLGVDVDIYVTNLLYWFSSWIDICSIIYGEWAR